MLDLFATAAPFGTVLSLAIPAVVLAALFVKAGGLGWLARRLG